MGCAAPAVDPCDPVALCAALIRCASVTPVDAGAQEVVARALEEVGFCCHKLRFEAPGTPPVENLFARLGTDAPNLAFAGHTDVVPPGEGWTHEPFKAAIEDGRLYGRGAVDMKGAIACFTAAIARNLRDHGRPRGSISVIITGDEEGPAVNGTKPLMCWAHEAGHRFDACILGECTSVEQVGDTFKIGRRGSLTGRLEVEGTQGHVAYPERVDNALHRTVRMLGRLIDAPLDNGSKLFEPSSLQLTRIETCNRATNIAPGRAEAVFNIRYGDSHTPQSLEGWLRQRLDVEGARYRLELDEAAEMFVSDPGPLTALVADAVEKVTGLRSMESTSGGTSDARFIHHYCPVVELGLTNATMHKLDEHVRLSELEALCCIYREIIERFFGQA